MNLISLFITSMLTSNIVLEQFLGVNPFYGNDKSSNALKMGLLVTSVTILSSVINYLIYYYILVPTKFIYLKNIIFVIIIIVIVKFISLFLKHKFNKLYKSLGLYFPFLITNAVAYSITLLNIRSNYSFMEMLINSIGSSIGFVVVIYLFSNIKEYISTKKIPDSFKGYPISFIVAGIMSLVFMRLG